MERSSDVLVLSGDFGWNDVGSWDMMKVIYDADQNGNIIVGDQVNIDTTNTISFSTGKMIPHKRLCRHQVSYPVIRLNLG